MRQDISGSGVSYAVTKRNERHDPLRKPKKFDDNNLRQEGDS